MLTEAHAALIRSVKDLNEFVQETHPELDTDASVSTLVAPANTAPVLQEATAVPGSASKKKEKKEKKVRDPDMPKRPVTAFFHFQNAIRQEMKNSLPDSASAADVQQALAAKWKEMDAEARKPYVAANEEALRTYTKEMDTYNKSHGIAPKQAPFKKTTPVAEPSSPNTSPTAEDEEDDVAAASVLQDVPSTPKSSKKRGRPAKKDGQPSAKKLKTPAHEAPAGTPKAEKKKKERKKKSTEQSA